MIQKIPFASYKQMPWKNGAGTTAEIAIEPEGSDFTKNEFLWRFSQASMKAASAFSIFPGYERLLAVWTGDGFLINNQELTPTSAPIAFSGEIPLECRLIGSEVKDLGLIFKRDRLHTEMKHSYLTPEKLLHEQSLEKGITFLFCVKGSFSVNGETLNEGDTLKITGPEKYKFSKDLKEKVEYFQLNLRIRL